MTNLENAAADQFVDLPEAMLAARRWLVWLSIPQPGKKPRKVPVYANGRQRNGVLDSEADLAQLATFDEACAALATGRYAGLGFALGPDGTGNHWQGVDLDDVAGHDGMRLLADDLPGYTETSPSGNGMHAVGYGRPFAALGSNGTGIEAYSAGRYFTVTGEGAGLGEPTDIADFVERVLAPRHGLRPAPVSAEVMTYVEPRTLAELRSALASMRADDRELWVANGQRLKRLGEPGRALWLEWSQQSDKFDPADAARVWDSFTADRTGHQAIFAEAQRRGWVNPMSSAAAAPAVVHAPTKHLFTLTRADRIICAPTPWLIRGYLVQDTLAGLIAPAGACKSFLAVDWACRVATGTHWHGREVRQGAVFYLAGEGQSGLRKRMTGWEIANKVSLEGAPLFVSSSLPFLCDPTNVAQSIAIMAEAVAELKAQTGVKPELVVIDTVARAMNGADENATDDMGRFIAAKDSIRKQWGCTVLSVHHTGHDAGAQKRGRGSSNYGASLDSDFYLTSKGEDVLLTAGTKAKDWPTPPPVTLTRVEVATPVIGEDGQPEKTLTLHDAAGSIAESSQRDKALELHRRGLSQRVIADTIGASKTTVQRWIKDAA